MSENRTAKSADSLRRAAPYLSRAGTVEVAERLFRCSRESEWYDGYVDGKLVMRIRIPKRQDVSRETEE